MVLRRRRGDLRRHALSHGARPAALARCGHADRRRGDDRRLVVAGLGRGATVNGAPWLLAGGILSAGAALLHVGCILGGPRWYRFFGAGERMVRLAERGSRRPAIITSGIVLVLAAWSAFAFSGAGVIAHFDLAQGGRTIVFLLA
eukprot:gene5432-7363_t